MKVNNCYRDPSVRQYGIYFVSTTNGNPNGDPDQDNSPRRDINGTMFMSDVSVKRILRNWASSLEEGIYVQSGESLKSRRQSVYNESTKDNVVDNIREAYWDVRMFGGVFADKKGQGFGSFHINGPVQVYAPDAVHSVEDNTEISITRCVQEDKDEHGTFGSKHKVPFVMFRGSWTLNPNVGDISEKDYDTFRDGFVRGFQADTSASKGRRGFELMIVFSHQDLLGNCSYATLEECVSVEQRSECVKNAKDLKLVVDHTLLPSGICMTVLDRDGNIKGQVDRWRASGE